MLKQETSAWQGERLLHRMLPRQVIKQLGAQLELERQRRVSEMTDCAAQGGERKMSAARAARAALAPPLVVPHVACVGCWSVHAHVARVARWRAPPRSRLEGFDPEPQALSAFGVEP